LCCRLLPVKEVPTLANERCKHQKFGKGCKVYGTAEMPMACKLWNCRWLVNDDTAELSRPDRSHYVIDIMPDFLEASWPGSPVMKIPVVQVWCDPHHPQAYRDPALRRYLERRAAEGWAAVIRSSDTDAFALFAPPLSDDGQWHEVHSNLRTTHNFGEVLEALSGV
jgi:hypothetical protein